MSNNTTQLGGTASSVSVGKIGVSVAPLIHHGPHSISILAWVNDDDVRASLCRLLSQHRHVFPSWRDPAVSDEEAFASLKAGMDSLPPGAKMFLNSGTYTNNYIQIRLAPSVPTIHNAQASSMGSIPQAPTSSSSRDSSSSTLPTPTRRSSP